MSELVKAPYDFVGERELGVGSDGGPVRTEAMLSGGNWEVVFKLWKQEAFQVLAQRVCRT